MTAGDRPKPMPAWTTCTNIVHKHVHKHIVRKSAQRRLDGRRWAQDNDYVTATPRRWLQCDTGQARVRRGSPRWIVGLTILGAGLLLVVSVFLGWGRIAIGGESNSIVQASVSGAGTVSVTMPQDDPEFERYAAQSLEQVVSHSGVWVAVIGILIIAAGAVYLWRRPRTEAAIAVAVLASIGSVFCLSTALDVRGMFDEALDSSYAHYWPGFGLIFACTMTVVLTALGGTAFVLERIAVREASPDSTGCRHG